MTVDVRPCNTLMKMGLPVAMACSKFCRSISMYTPEVIARTVAVLGAGSISAISPIAAPAPSSAKIVSPLLTTTEPAVIMIKEYPKNSLQ